MITLLTKTETAVGPQVRFDCPACGTADVTSQLSESVERTKLYGLIPLVTFRNTWVTCPHCDATLYTSLPMDQLVQQAPESINGFIRYGASTTARLLAIVGILIFWIPVAGFVVPAWALYLARGTKGWTRRGALLGVIAGAAVTATIIIMKVSGMKI